MCAEMVHAWGAYAGGPDDLPAADERNPRGRWEYLPLWDLLAEIGGFAAGASWWDEDFGSKAAAKAADPQIAARARELVARMEAAGRPWMWKEPAFCHFLGFWRQFWSSPVYVVMVRHPGDVAVSWNQFRAAGGGAELSLECNLLRWQHMMLSVLRELEDEPAVLFAEYEAVTGDPPGQAGRLAAFLDRHCAAASCGSVVDAMAATCVPSYRRNREGLDREDVMTPSQRSLYQFLRRKIRQPRLPFTAEFSMPAGWRELVISQEASR